MQIQRSIFLYWDQGWKEAPDLVKRCGETWSVYNPSWNVFYLDRSNVEEIINIPYLARSINLPLPALSDVIRLVLLKHHGGVWADATLWCARPLDDWIDGCMSEAGFFCYSGRGLPYARINGLRPLSSWFLAAIPGSRILTRWHTIMMQFLLKIKLSSIFGAFGESLFSCLMPQLKGLSIPINGQSDVGEYWWVHRLFQLCMENDPEFFELWLSVPKISSDEPTRLSRFGLLNEPDLDIMDHIYSVKANMYKLNRKKVDIPSDISGTVLDLLYRSHPSRKRA